MRSSGIRRTSCDPLGTPYLLFDTSMLRLVRTKSRRRPRFWRQVQIFPSGALSSNARAPQVRDVRLNFAANGPTEHRSTRIKSTVRMGRKGGPNPRGIRVPILEFATGAGISETRSTSVSAGSKPRATAGTKPSKLGKIASDIHS